MLSRFDDGEHITCAEHEACEYMELWEQYICELLSEHYEAFSRRALDGLSPVLHKRTREHEAELFAMCWLIDDQSQVPMHVWLRVQPVGDAVASLHCRWGEADAVTGRLVRTTYSAKQTARLSYDLDRIEWFYDLHLAAS
jgi:hypothetical protein